MYKYTILFSLFTIPLAVIVLNLTGGGHGLYTPFLVFFPVGFLGIVSSEPVNIFFFILGLFQFPVYGFVIDKIKKRNIGLYIFLFHISLVVIIFILEKDDLFKHELYKLNL
jgi:hypothetical protein